MLLRIIGIVSQASPHLQQFIHQLGHSLDSLFSSRSFKRFTRRIDASKGWLLALVVVLLLLIWNWQLVVSGGMGLAAMLVVYLVQQGQWRLPKIDWQNLWSSSNRSLTLALGTGVIVSFSSYVAVAVWQETGGSWLAKAILLEGAGILVILLLLGWQRLEPYTRNGKEANPDRLINQLLEELADSDPLKRLIAVRRLTQWMTESPATNPASNPVNTHDPVHPSVPLSAAHLADCFRLMLNRETEPIVCRALLESLQSLNPSQQKPQPTRQLQGGQAIPFSAQDTTHSAPHKQMGSPSQ